MDRGKATTTLSSGTLNIISETRGVLSLSEMRKFLNQVRGKKKGIEIARCFTSNIPALVKQLKNIEANYHKQGRKGIRMDKDIDFIKRLHKRLVSSDDRCASNDDFFQAHHHNERAHQARPLVGGRNEHVFASTSVYKRTSNKAAKEQPNSSQAMSYSSGTMDFVSTRNYFHTHTQSVFASTSSYKQKSAAAAKMKSSGRRKASLSSGTIKIISNTRGPLNPHRLCKFLKEVRGKKRATEIASRFASNIPALINQLQEVETNYSRSGRKGVKMKKDIDFIRRLRMRLREDRNEDYAAERFSRQIQEIREEYSTEYSDENSSEEYSTDEDSEYSSSGSSTD